MKSRGDGWREQRYPEAGVRGQGRCAPRTVLSGHCAADCEEVERAEDGRLSFHATDSAHQHRPAIVNLAGRVRKNRRYPSSHAFPRGDHSPLSKRISRPSTQA